MSSKPSRWKITTLIRGWKGFHNGCKRKKTPSEETIKTVAREIALTTLKSQEEYDRHRCFTPFAISYSDIHRNMVMSRKKPLTEETEK
ncbi:MAG: hypothetical protein ABFS56_06355 [Pseudomonadota bacterium]